MKQQRQNMEFGKDESSKMKLKRQNVEFRKDESTKIGEKMKQKRQNM